MKKIVLLTLTLFSFILAHSQTFNIYFGTLNRDYIVHTPVGYNSANQYPLVFNLHGYTSDATQEQFYTQMNATSDANDFIVVYPNGIANAWNSGFVGTYGTGIDDVGFISAIIDSMNKNFSINLNRVYACGMSNGGYQSYRLACELSNRIAAIASVTGSMTDSTYFYCNPTRPVPTMQVHGTTDGTVNYNGFPGSKPIEDVIQFWSDHNLCTAAVETTAVPNINTTDNTTADFIQIKGCTLGIENWFYKVYNGGHTWPGSVVDIIGSNTNRDFNASQRIWDFFNRYTLAGPTSIQNTSSSTDMLLYPNPTYNQLQITTNDNNQAVDIVIMDLLGKSKLQEHIQVANGQAHVLDVSSLDAGNYILQYKLADGSLITKKFAVIK